MPCSLFRRRKKISKRPTLACKETVYECMSLSCLSCQGAINNLIECLSQTADSKLKMAAIKIYERGPFLNVCAGQAVNKVLK